jgi:hypothetical protein
MNTDELRYRAVSGLGGRLIGGLLSTARFSTEGEHNYRGEWDAGRPVIFTLWHGRLLPLSWYHRAWNLVTLISASADGEYIARLVSRWGYDVVRGSSSRGGGPALRHLVRFVREGRSIAVTPDGPRGPRERLKPGVLSAAQLTGCALLPVGAGASRSWWFEGWDRFMVPTPFARIHIVYGEPVPVPRNAGDTELAAITERVEAAMSRITSVAEAHVAA